MNDQQKANDESLADVLREMCEAGLLAAEEVVNSFRPSDLECEQAKRRFWQFNAKVASGIAAFAERQMRNTRSEASPRRAETIVVEED